MRRNRLKRRDRIRQGMAGNRAMPAMNSLLFKQGEAKDGPLRRHRAVATPKSPTSPWPPGRLQRRPRRLRSRARLRPLLERPARHPLLPRPDRSSRRQTHRGPPSLGRRGQGMRGATTGGPAGDVRGLRSSWGARLPARSQSRQRPRGPPGRRPRREPRRVTRRPRAPCHRSRGRSRRSWASFRCRCGS